MSTRHWETAAPHRAVVRALREALEAHLRHEEATALPLAEAVLAPGERRALAIDAGGRCRAGAPLFVPWVVDGIAPVERSRVPDGAAPAATGAQLCGVGAPLPQTPPVEPLSPCPPRGGAGGQTGTAAAGRGQKRVVSRAGTATPAARPAGRAAPAGNADRPRRAAATASSNPTWLMVE